MSMTQQRWSETRVAEALAAYYADASRNREFVFLTQVRNATGFSGVTRTADALAIGTWPSRGIYATGFEIKVQRGDFLKELSQPEKADEIGRFCRHWFIAAPIGLVKPAELPLNWGLVEVKEDGKLKWTKPGNANENAITPTWEFMASVFRNIGSSMVPAVDVNRRIAAAQKQERERQEAIAAANRTQAERELERMRTKIESFEKASGVHLDKYSEYFNQEIGEAVRFVRECHRAGGGTLGAVRELQSQMLRMANSLGGIIQSIDAAQEEQAA